MRRDLCCDFKIASVFIIRLLMVCHTVNALACCCFPGVLNTSYEVLWVSLMSVRCAYCRELTLCTYTLD